MEPFTEFPWWAQVVFVGTNTFILFIIVLMITQYVRTIRSRKENSFDKKKIKPSDERGKEYGSEHSSSYIDA